ncbi:MAG: hypothetical protein IPP71_16000 [Bacteroidetes bacterium]|nr:hypothetical protein [Bacteroidota bacterium]
MELHKHIVPENGDAIGIPMEHKDLINSVVYSPDGKLVLTSSNDNTARLWSANTGELLNELEHKGAVNSARFSPDGLLIVTAL